MNNMSVQEQELTVEQKIEKLLSQVEAVEQKMAHLESSYRLSLLNQRKYNKGDKVLIANTTSGGTKEVTIIDYGLAKSVWGEFDQLYYTVVPKKGWPEEKIWGFLIESESSKKNEEYNNGSKMVRNIWKFI